MSPVSDELAALRHAVTPVAYADVSRRLPCPQRFPADAAGVSPTTPERWLSGPCDRKLGPSDRSV
jgi:hypothetical protein